MSTVPNPYAADLGGRDPIEALRHTPARIRELASDWPDTRFEGTYAPGKWTARQILIHLAQTELALGTRARMALATPHYAAQSFDQDAWMRLEAGESSGSGGSGGLTGREALDAFVSIATMNRVLFASLSAADRATPLTHPEYGALTVDWIVHQMAGHQIHHLKQLEQIATR